MEDAQHYSGLLIEMGRGGGRKKGKLTREDAQHYSGLLNAIPDIYVRPWIPNYQTHLRTKKHILLIHRQVSIYIEVWCDCFLLFFR